MFRQCGYLHHLHSTKFNLKQRKKNNKIWHLDTTTILITSHSINLVHQQTVLAAINSNIRLMRP